jgi:predicted enzyme related to lactoylglutathione lyase
VHRQQSLSAAVAEMYLIKESAMFTNSPVVHSFSVSDISETSRFYGETLGLDVAEAIMGNLEITFGDGSKAFVYQKDDHEPATFTILNFVSDDLEATVDELNSRGITTKLYEDTQVPGLTNNEKGVVFDEDGEAQIVWFKDPSGNVLAVVPRDPDQ